MVSILCNRYKKYKKDKYEKIIKECTRYNLWRINYYKNNEKNIVTPKEFEDKIAIATLFCKGFYDENFKKYNVNESLFNEMKETYEIALLEYDEMQKRQQVLKKEKDNKSKILLCKKAILELKEEGKL